MSSQSTDNIQVRRRLRWYTYVGDFLNTLKAFIGINYQVLPFAFAQSGLGFGLVGVFIVASLTDHCCQILVRCKISLIERRCMNEREDGKPSEEKVESLKEQLQLSIGYGDIGKELFGNVCYRIIQVLVCFTQFLACLIYFVFIANTISVIFPLRGIESCNSTDNATHSTTSKVYASRMVDVPPTVTSSYPALNGTTTTTQQPPCEYVSSSPDLRLLVLIPLPFFIVTSLIRKVRYLAPFSSIATVALGVGAVSVFAFIIHEFKVVSFEWYKILTLPVFFCQLISAYEGIGCILPIQSSMVGCRHLFPRYLHASIGLIFVILCTFGVLGYLSYGDSVQQMIVLEIDQHTILSIVVDVTLIVSVLFTYPLQCFPVIEIIESILLPNGKSLSRQNSVQEDTRENDELQPLMPTFKIPSWKRNIIRIILTLVIAGLAVLLRDYFAYLAAFSGAIGSTMLALILPCMFDIRLRYGELTRLVLIKDIFIIAFAIIVSLLGIAATIVSLIRGTGGGV